MYLSYYGAVTFFLQMEPVRQEQGAHVKQNTHAMQREKQHAMQCNAMQQEKQHGSNAMIKASTHAMGMRKVSCMQGNATCNAK